MKFFTPDRFDLKEVLPEIFYRHYHPLYGENLWQLFSFEIRWTLHQIRQTFGPTIVNTWQWNPEGAQYRGYRPLDCAVGAKASQHKFGKAIDMTFKRYSVDQVRNEILANPDRDVFKYINCIEMKVPWLHLSCQEAEPGVSRIMEIYP